MAKKAKRLGIVFFVLMVVGITGCLGGGTSKIQLAVNQDKTKLLDVLPVRMETLTVTLQGIREGSLTFSTPEGPSVPSSVPFLEGKAEIPQFFTLAQAKSLIITVRDKSGKEVAKATVALWEEERDAPRMQGQFIEEQGFLLRGEYQGQYPQIPHWVFLDPLYLSALSHQEIMQLIAYLEGVSGSSFYVANEEGKARFQTWQWLKENSLSKLPEEGLLLAYLYPALELDGQKPYLYWDLRKQVFLSFYPYSISQYALKLQGTPSVFDEGAWSHEENTYSASFEVPAVPLGTPLEDILPLPGELRIVFSNQDQTYFPVEWNEEQKRAYNPQEAGSYQIEGMLPMPYGLTNPRVEPLDVYRLQVTIHVDGQDIRDILLTTFDNRAGSVNTRSHGHFGVLQALATHTPVTFALVLGKGDNHLFTLSDDRVYVGPWDLSAGEYTLVVDATDTQGTTKEKEFSFTIAKAPVTNTSRGKDYVTLQEALLDAGEGEVLRLKEDLEERVTLENKAFDLYFGTSSLLGSLTLHFTEPKEQRVLLTGESFLEGGRHHVTGTITLNLNANAQVSLENLAVLGNSPGIILEGTRGHILTAGSTTTLYVRGQGIDLTLGEESTGQTMVRIAPSGSLNQFIVACDPKDVEIQLEAGAKEPLATNPAGEPVEITVSHGLRFLEENALSFVEIALFLVGEDTPVLTLKTNEEGEALGFLPVGDYRYTITKEYYLPQEGMVSQAVGGVVVPFRMVPRRHRVTFTLEPAEATLLVEDHRGVELQPVSKNTYELPRGSYRYRVSHEGYVSKSEVFSVEKDPLAIFVSLQQRKYTVTFTIDPPSARLEVRDGETVMEAVAEGVYHLPPRVYTYSVTKEGYLPLYQSFQVIDGPLSISCELALEGYLVTFVETGALEDVVIQVFADEARTRLVAQTRTNQQGSGSLALAKGRYFYTASMEGYLPYKGVFTLEEDRSIPFAMETGLETVSITDIPGVLVPHTNKHPLEVITPTAQYTGTVVFHPSDTPFLVDTVYTATITLIALDGYTLIGVLENSFQVAGAERVTHAANSGVVTAVFPKTVPPHIEWIAPVSPRQVEFGTTKQGALAALSRTTTLRASDEQDYAVELDWVIPEYDGNVPGAYQAEATFSLPEGLVQSTPPLDLRVETTLTVLPKVVVWKLRDLGPEGDLAEPGNVFSIYENEPSGEWTVRIIRSRLPEELRTYAGYQLVLGQGRFPFVPNLAVPQELYVHIPSNHGIETIRDGIFRDYSPRFFNLQVQKEGQGQTTPTLGTHTYQEGTVVPLQAIPDSGYRFSYWHGAVASTDQATTTVTMDQSKVVKAVFEALPDQAILTMQVQGQGQTIPSQGTHTYDQGTVVPIQATPGPGYRFKRWEGSVEDSSLAATTVWMSESKTVRAVFELIPAQVTLTIEKQGEGQTTPILGVHTFDQGTTVSLNAVPALGYRFLIWEGDVANPNQATTTVQMNESKTLKAIFEESPVGYVFLTVEKQGQGEVTPAVGSHSFAEGTVVPLTATPGSGYRFRRWEGDVANPTNPSTTVTMDQEKTVKAVFEDSSYDPAKYIVAIEKVQGVTVDPLSSLSATEFIQGLPPTLHATTSANTKVTLSVSHWLDVDNFGAPPANGRIPNAYRFEPIFTLPPGFGIAPEVGTPYGVAYVVKAELVFVARSTFIQRDEFHATFSIGNANTTRIAFRDSAGTAIPREAQVTGGVVVVPRMYLNMSATSLFLQLYQDDLPLGTELEVVLVRPE